MTQLSLHRPACPIISRKKAHFVIRKKFHFPRASRWMGKRKKLLTGQIFRKVRNDVNFSRKSAAGLFFAKEKLNSTRPPRQPRKFVAKLDIYHFWSLCCKLWRALQKIQFHPIWSQPARCLHPPTSGSQMFVSLRTKKIFSRRVNGWGVKNLEQVQPFSKCKQNPGELTLLKDF